METMPNMMPEEESQEDIKMRTAEDLGMDPMTGELPVDRELDAKLGQSENPEEEEMKEAA